MSASLVGSEDVYKRQALCTSIEMASKSRKHNNANVLALGGRVLEDNLAFDIVNEFLNTDFEAGRHSIRVDKI